MERGLSSESNSVSSPPTPSKKGFSVSHLKSSPVTDMDYLLVNLALVVEHTGDFVGV